LLKALLNSLACPPALPFSLLRTGIWRAPRRKWRRYHPPRPPFLPTGKTRPARREKKEPPSPVRVRGGRIGRGKGGKEGSPSICGLRIVHPSVIHHTDWSRCCRQQVADGFRSSCTALSDHKSIHPSISLPFILAHLASLERGMASSFLTLLAHAQTRKHFKY